MKGSAKLSVAISLALIGSNALALGLGSIQVKSKLNQPLYAEIPVMADSSTEANGLNVDLASAEDFQRVGLDRARVDVPLQFSLGTDSRGQTVIKVTTHDIVREPLLDFLIAVNWPKGKLLREYTVLLDPPVTAPALAAASVSPAHEAPRAKPQPLPAEHEHVKPKPKPAPVKPPHAEVAHAKPAPKPAPAKPAPVKSVAHAAAAGEYGPVAAGETLSEIAGATRPDDNTNLDAMMLALLKANPNAFFRDNINALKRGAILRIPGHDEIKAGGSAAAVAAAVREQNQAWASNAPVAKPTLVAKTGAPKIESAPAKSAVRSETKSGSHLALVPPRAGKGGQSSSDHPGASSGTGSAQTEAELTRTKEALTSREQEVTDLKSRVKDLTKINDDDKRLLTLKQNEIAELQNKLKQLETAQAVKPVALAPAPAKSAPAAPVVGAKAPETKPLETKPAELAAKPGEEAAKTPPKLTAKDIWGNIGASENPTPAKPAAAPAAPATPAPTATAPAESKPAPESTASATLPAESVPVKPIETKPASTPVAVKPKPEPKVAPLAPPELPWWQNNNVLLGGGGALLIIGLLALMRFMRKPKLAPVAAAGMEAAHDHADAMVADEQHLLDQLAQHPGDPQLSLQLLDLYYAHGDASRFESAAEAMYAHIADPTQPEWQQVRAMGEHLCPHNPLFGANVDMTDAYAHDHAAHDTYADGTVHDEAHTHLHDEHLDADSYATHTDLAKPADDNFDFDLTEHAASEPTAPSAAAPTHAPTPVAAAAPLAAAAAKPAEDFFAGEDAIGTKLDLAKAYLDMGDPEGARSMLDEVLAEGNDAQKIEARKLLAEIS